MQRFQAYYRLAKPGIIYGNALTVLGGYLLGARTHARWQQLTAVMAGSALVIGGACVINNYLDRRIDRQMQRTRQRSLVTGAISPLGAWLYAILLMLSGFLLLVWLTNWLTVLVGLIGVLDYVVLYGWGKRNSVHGTLVGSISGAMPVVAGYVAATNRFDAGAWLLLLILVCWQMPHFYAIALYRSHDYKNAKIPVLPVIRGVRHTQRQIMVYIGAFGVACLLLSVCGYTGWTFLIAMVGISSLWLKHGACSYMETSSEIWGQSMFRYSLLVIVALSLLLPLGAYLP